MEPIDVAADKLLRLMSRLGGYADTIRSEQDTRLKVINPVFHEVLAWPLAEIHTEEHAGDGFIDYRLSVGGRARLIVEAKRDGRELGLGGRGAGRPYKLNGPVFATEAVKEGIAQAIRYCGQKNAELACVTNGREWLVFRGSRLGDGLDTMDGMAIVFPSLQDVRAHFGRFYNLLSYESVSSLRYRVLFQEAEGRPIRTHHFRRSLRDPKTPYPLPADNLSADIERVMTSFFRRLSGDDDPDFLTECFVVTRESQIADRQLARISEDLLGRIRDLDTGSGDQLTALVERVRITQRNEFVLLVGTKGAGKSTFIDRFFRSVLPKSLRDDCVVARVNLADSPGGEPGIDVWLDQRLLDVLERAVFGMSAPTYDELQGIYFGEYLRLSTGAWAPIYERDKEQFKIDFGRHVERRREERPHEYIRHLVRDIVLSRRKIPCLIFDNADHFTIEFQERVFQYARSIYEDAICLVIMPITDRTSWQLSREGALRSFETESLFLPTPLPEKVLQRRVEYLEAKLAEERRAPGRGYFLGRGIPLSIDNLTAFTAALQAIFLKEGQVSKWIGSLANNDIRRCLEIAQSVVSSPHLAVHELISAFLAGTNVDVPPAKIRRAIIKQRYNIYPGEINKYIWNVYALDEGVDASPLTGLRLLQFLEDARRSDRDNPFVGLGQIVDYCRAMYIDDGTALAWLSRMLDAGLCLSYDPTITKIGQVDRVEISAAGYQHLRWGLRDPIYIEAMLEVTPLVDQELFDHMDGLYRHAADGRWPSLLASFVAYLHAEDAKYCKVPPSHEAYAAQRSLVDDLGRVLGNRDSASSVDGRPVGITGPSVRRSTRSRPPRKNKGLHTRARWLAVTSRETGDPTTEVPNSATRRARNGDPPDI